VCSETIPCTPETRRHFDTRTAVWKRGPEIKRKSFPRHLTGIQGLAIDWVFCFVVEPTTTRCLNSSTSPASCAI
jgi:hypothetical protein